MGRDHLIRPHLAGTDAECFGCRARCVCDGDGTRTCVHCTLTRLGMEP